MKPGQTVYAVNPRSLRVATEVLASPFLGGYWIDGEDFRKDELFETREAAEAKLTELINDRIKALEAEITELKSKLPQQKPAI